MENVEIPFMGDNDVSVKTLPGQLAPWVEPNDRVPLLLALSLYETPRKELEGFVLFRSDVRCAAWIGPNNVVIIGCRGTSVGGRHGSKDLADDKIIALNADYCDLTLVQLVTKLVKDVTDKLNNVSSTFDKVKDFVLGRKKKEQTNITPYFVFAGHSLGGTAAICLGMKYTDNSRSISFNGGAAPTNPVYVGPGAQRATHYHIVGDLISTHMNNSAAKVIRIKMPDIAFGTLSAHSSGNLLSRPFIVYTPTQEDIEYVAWGRTDKVYSVVSKVLALTPYNTFLKVSKIVESEPIPNSDRWIAKQVMK
jgi:hypothetical protein